MKYPADGSGVNIMYGFVKKNIYTIIFTLVMFIMFAGYLFGDDGEFSVTENRYLARRPSVSLSSLLDGSFMTGFELYTEEQLPLRDGLIRLKALCAEIAFKNENNGIAKGKEGQLFEKLVNTDKQLNKNSAAIENFVKMTDREIYVCIVPNSYEIQKDRTPTGFPGISQRARIRELYDGLSEYKNVHTVDLYDTLNENADQYIYYRTDHHWTTDGAYLGYRKLCEDMGLSPVDTDSEEMKEKRREAEGFYGTYQSKYRGMIGIKPDTLTYYDIEVAGYETGGSKYDSLYDTGKLDIYDKYAMFMHGNEGLSTVEAAEDEAGGRRNELIIFKDSYANCMIPFLTYDYDRITVIDLRYYPDPVKELLSEHEDADILLFYNFMHFNEDNHFYRLTS